MMPGFEIERPHVGDQEPHHERVREPVDPAQTPP